jgi:hypothetical protein
MPLTNFETSMAHPSRSLVTQTSNRDSPGRIRHTSCTQAATLTRSVLRSRSAATAVGMSLAPRVAVNLFGWFLPEIQKFMICLIS